ncbi:MAG: hypothetical protein AAFP84_18345, partial [Actinomycetota bacterium]
ASLETIAAVLDEALKCLEGDNSSEAQSIREVIAVILQVVNIGRAGTRIPLGAPGKPLPR